MERPEKEKLSQMTMNGTVNYFCTVHNICLLMKIKTKTLFFVSNGDMLFEKPNRVKQILPKRQQPVREKFSKKTRVPT